MPLTLQCEHFPLTEKELEDLWQATRERMHVPDDTVTLECVSIAEIQRLNREYRNKDVPTNILTFSYAPDTDHDIALCMDIAAQEASERSVALREYTALLVVHALLHVSGEDHEKSKQDSLHTAQAEREILLACGFVPEGLSDVY
ncbi:MAG TPA: rRNA maturation RNase YbeY [Candidatus Andersenbacteria bacterium]|nr:rRNA maturation RNase YbeY [Candidatus Andersenbacteria bacterium]